MATEWPKMCYHGSRLKTEDDCNRGDQRVEFAYFSARHAIWNIRPCSAWFRALLRSMRRSVMSTFYSIPVVHVHSEVHELVRDWLLADSAAPVM